MLIAFLPILQGCKTTAGAVDPATLAARSGFLVDGRTREQEVLNRLGTPQAIYQSPRILIYHVRVDSKGRIGLSGDTRDTCDALVLAFDADVLLQRHSLVKNGCH
jgi:hypothetical protein